MQQFILMILFHDLWAQKGWNNEGSVIMKLQKWPEDAGCFFFHSLETAKGSVGQTDKLKKERKRAAAHGNHSPSDGRWALLHDRAKSCIISLTQTECDS